MDPPQLQPRRARAKRAEAPRRDRRPRRAAASDQRDRDPVESVPGAEDPREAVLGAEDQKRAADSGQRTRERRPFADPARRGDAGGDGGVTARADRAPLESAAGGGG